MSWAAGWWQLLSCHAVVTPGADRILRAPAMSDTGTWPPTPLTGTELSHAWTGTWLWLTLTSPPASPPVPANAAGAHMPIIPAVAAATARTRLLLNMPGFLLFSGCSLLGSRWPWLDCHGATLHGNQQITERFCYMPAPARAEYRGIRGEPVLPAGTPPHGAGLYGDLRIYTAGNVRESPVRQLLRRSYASGLPQLPGLLGQAAGTRFLSFSSVELSGGVTRAGSRERQRCQGRRRREREKEAAGRAGQAAVLRGIP